MESDSRQDVVVETFIRAPPEAVFPFLIDFRTSRSSPAAPTRLTSRWSRWTVLPSKWSAQKEQCGHPSLHAGLNMK